MDDETVASLARELDGAEASQTPVRQLSLRFPQMTIEDGYRIARAWVELKKAAGRRSIGSKIGLTQRAMQSSACLTEPASGTLLDVWHLRDGGEIPLQRSINLKLVVACAFLLLPPP